MCKNAIMLAWNKEKKLASAGDLKILKKKFFLTLKKALNDFTTSKIEAVHSLHAQLHPKNLPTRNQIGGKMELTTLYHNIGYNATITLQANALVFRFLKRFFRK